MSKWSFRSLSSSFTAKILHIYPKTPVSFVGSHVPGRPRGLVLCCNGFFSRHSIACKVARHQHSLGACCQMKIFVWKMFRLMVPYQRLMIPYQILRCMLFKFGQKCQKWADLS